MDGKSEVVVVVRFESERIESADLKVFALSYFRFTALVAHQKQEQLHTRMEVQTFAISTIRQISNSGKITAL